jgi:hypothetical protein
MMAQTEMEARREVDFGVLHHLLVGGQGPDVMSTMASGRIRTRSASVSRAG